MSDLKKGDKAVVADVEGAGFFRGDKVRLIMKSGNKWLVEGESIGFHSWVREEHLTRY